MITGYMKNASPCCHWEWGGEYAKTFVTYRLRMGITKVYDELWTFQRGKVSD